MQRVLPEIRRIVAGRTRSAATPSVIPRALRDEEADRRLRTDGFAVVPFPLDADVVAILRDAYAALHGWSGSGFEADLNNRDRTYRGEVSRLLTTHLDDAVEGMFVGFTPFARVFLCKWPGDDSDLYLHQDWMYVDERHGNRTYNVWIPLADVGPADGPLQVLPGSHRYDDALRGTNLTARWVNDDALVRPRLLTVPVRLGEAAVFDNALVHCSPANDSSEPRLVAAVGMRPRHAPLVHFRQRDAGTAVRYDIDESFFLTITPEELMAAPPELPVAEVLERLPPDVPRQLAADGSGPPDGPPGSRAAIGTRMARLIRR